MPKWITRGGLLALTLLLILWLARWTPLREVEVVAMLVAPDKAIAVSMLLVSLMLVVTGAWMGSKRHGAMLAVGWLVVAAMFGGRAVAQGIMDPAPGQSTASLLTVVSWNAQGVPPQEMMDRLIDVIRERDVDVLVLPETGGSIGEMAAEQLTYLGWSNTPFVSEEATSVFIRSDLARTAGYQLAPGNPPWAGVTVAPEVPSAAAPIIVATHIQQPSPGNLSIRAEHLQWVEQICNTNQYVLAVGDFNSTLNHLDGAQLGKCADIASEHGAGATSTWPTWLPSWLGISIDRAMLSPPDLPGSSTFEVLRNVDTSGVEGWGTGARTEHWPILITIEETG